MRLRDFIIGCVRRIEKNYHRLLLNKIVCDLKSAGTNMRISFPIYTHGLENISIGDNFTSGSRLKLRTFNKWEEFSFHPQITIGNNVSIESDCHISAINSVTIGDNVLMASFVYISDHSHGKCSCDEIILPPIRRQLFSKGPVRIGKNVWLGEKVTILPNVTIGECCIIGANLVVTHDIPPYSIAVGNPAHVIRSIKV